jgi:quinol-cytochrome oxidoreductase complex cytochrome b subunit
LRNRPKGVDLDVARTGIAAWFRERVDLSPLWGVLAKKTVPSHRHSWIYLLGGAALFLFACQACSGCLLLLYYQPTESTAHESVEKIMTQVPYGWLVRSMHAWGANLFIGIVVLHFLSVLFTRAYRKPRELTWLTGTLMLFLALGFGFSGYLLPWNELAYYATLVGTKIPSAVPGVGDLVVHFLRGGEQVTGATITRFFAAHVFILPAMLAGLISAHLMLIQLQGTSLPLSMSQQEVKEHRPFFSEFLLTEACLWLLLAGTIVTLAVVHPAEMGIKADPLQPAPDGIKPEWYFWFLFKTLKLVPETLGVAMFAMGALFLLTVPFLDRRAMRGQRSPGFTLVFVAILLYAAVFEVLAWLDPGLRHSGETLKAETYSLSNGLVSLALFWCLIGFFIFCLRRLLQENARVRRLYREAN